MMTKNHDLLKSEASLHIDADALVQGKYWDSESQKGCFIGCLSPSHGDKPEELGELYGLPESLVRLCEYIFEKLPLEEAKAFFAAIPEAIGCDGKDLSMVAWKFLAADLGSLLLVLEEDAYCAADAAYCAARAASAPRLLRDQHAIQASRAIREPHVARAVVVACQRDTLLNLIRES